MNFCTAPLISLRKRNDQFASLKRAVVLNVLQALKRREMRSLLFARADYGCLPMYAKIPPST